MSKLIYAPSASLIEGTYSGIKNADQAVNTVYHSVAFTGDGYMYTHGKKFRLFLVQNEGLTGISFNITNGTAQLLIDGVVVGSGTAVQSVTGDTIVAASTTNGAVTLTHKEYLSLNSPTQYGSNNQIPIITIDKYGHITAVSNGTTLDVTKVVANTTQTAGNYYLTGVTNSNAQNPIYSTNAYIDQNGNLYAATIYQNGSSISTLFAPMSHTSVEGDSSTLGHVYLHDTYDNSKDADSAYAATPKAVAGALSDAQQYTRNLMAAQDAMVFAGTITHEKVIVSHNTDLFEASNGVSTLDNIEYKTGYSFRFTTAGTFGTQEVEVGDMIIAVNDYNNEFSYSDWTIIQTNISGALTANSVLNGVLYASNSRTVQALALSNGVLTSNGSALSFVNKNTLWRPIKVNNNSIGTEELSLKTTGHVSYTVNNGEVTLSVDDASIIATAASLTLTQGNETFTYNPSTASNLLIGAGLTLEDTTVSGTTYKQLRHATGSTITSKLGKITTDAYGHVTSVEEVSSLPNAYSLSIKNNAGTSLLTYKGDANKVLKFLNGTDISLSLSENATTKEIEVTPSITHKYRPVQFYATSTASSSISLLANSVDTALTLVAGDNITLTHQDSNNTDLPAGTLVIHAEDTWRNIEAYKFVNNSLTRSSIGNNKLKFDDSLLIVGDELGICWTEIDANGTVTYVK